MFQLGQTVRTKDKNPMEGVVSEIKRVGCIDQILIETKHGPFLFRDGELQEVAGVPIAARTKETDLLSLKSVRESSKALVAKAVLPDLRTCFDAAIPIKNEKPLKINWVEKYKELFGVNIKTLFPSYNNGQLAMAAKKAVEKRNIEPK